MHGDVKKLPCHGEFDVDAVGMTAFAVKDHPQLMDCLVRLYVSEMLSFMTAVFM